VMGCPAGKPGQGRVRAALVDEDELLGVARGDRFPPGGARLLVALAGRQRRLFCVQPRRRRARHRTASREVLPVVLLPPGAVLHHGGIRRRFQSGAQTGFLVLADAPWAAGTGRARARPSRAVAPPRASRSSPPPQSGERLLAWADRWPPLAPVVLYRSVEEARIRRCSAQSIPASGSRKLL